MGTNKPHMVPVSDETAIPAADAINKASFCEGTTIIDGLPLRFVSTSLSISLHRLGMDDYPA